MKRFLGLMLLVLSAAVAHAAEPLRVVMISGADEYDSNGSLAALKKQAEEKYNVACTLISGKQASFNELKGLEALDNADVLVVYCRRFKLPPEQLEKIKKFASGGKAIVGIRTASHAFQEWLEMDKVVLGGDYKNHYGDDEVKIAIEEKAKDHPVLSGVSPFTSRKMYKNPEIAKDDTVLLTGTNKLGTDPLAWVRTVNGGRVFYTSLGTQEDFQNEGYRQMLINALFWTANRSVEKK